MPLQINRHQKRRHLVIGHVAAREAIDKPLDFGAGQRFAVAFFGKNIYSAHVFPYIVNMTEHYLNKKAIQAAKSNDSFIERC